MNVDIIIKIVGLIGSIVASYKIITEVVINKKSRFRDEYIFAKEFIIELKNDKQLHPFLIEKAYHAISGKYLAADEIIYLLEFPFSSRALRNFASARATYVEYSQIEKRINFIGRYNSENYRKFYKYIKIIAYTIFALLALVPLFFATSIFKSFWSSEFFIILAFMLSFGFIAISQLISLGNIVGSEKLVIDCILIQKTKVKSKN